MSAYRNIFQSASTERIKRFYRYFKADKALGEFGINAIVETLPEQTALDLARKSDERQARNEALSAIDGAVVTVKDTASLPVAGWATHYGSKLWPHEVDRVDAPAVASLRDAGCVIVGRTTAPEFGWKGTTSSPRFNVTRSAIDLTRTSGGSSGGAASSVAAGMADLGVGTDAAGSVRIPAAIQGLVGFKPSMERIKSPHSSEMSGPGLIARSVSLVSTAFDIITGSPISDPPITEHNSGSGGRWRLAFSKTLGGLADPTAEIEQIVRKVLDDVVRRHLGSDVEDAEPSLNPSAVWDCCLTFYFAKLAFLMSQLQLSAESTELDPGLRVLMSSSALNRATERLGWARSERRNTQQLISRFQVDNHYDLIVTPTLGREPDLAAPPEEDYLDHGRPFWESFTNVASHTYLFNITGQPAVTVPCGFTQSGQPVSLQFVGQVGGDSMVLEVAYAFERALHTVRGIPEVILINGPSSAGKSTLARRIANELSKPVSDFRLVSFDDFAAKGMAPRHWSRQFVQVAGGPEMLQACVGPEAWRYDERRTAPDARVSRDDPPSCALTLTDLGFAYLVACFQRWATMLRCGISLVIDHYLMDPNWYWAMKERFNEIVYKQISVGLFCDTEVLQVREALRSQLEARVCGTAKFSVDLVHEIFLTAAGSDYELKFRSDTSEEQLWAQDEYENVVLRRQGVRTPKPPSSETAIAQDVIAALNRLLIEQIGQ